MELVEAVVTGQKQAGMSLRLLKNAVLRDGQVSFLPIPVSTCILFLFLEVSVDD